MSLLLKARPFVPQRLFHSTVCAKHLVGPVDPISNIRPIIYDDDPTPSASSSSFATQSQNNGCLLHPYSLKEFSGDIRDYQWKLQRQQLDAFDHLFWSDNNSRFEAAKAAALDALPENSTLEDHEFVLAEFYRNWLIQETPRLAAYNSEWRKRNFDNIILAARSEWAKLLSSFGIRQS